MTSETWRVSVFVTVAWTSDRGALKQKVIEVGPCPSRPQAI